MTSRILLRGLVFLASLVAVAYFFRSSDLGSVLDETWIDREVRGRGASGELLFLAAGAIATALSLPRQVVAFLGGYAFGLVWGTTLALLATMLGCLSSFWYARLLGRRLVVARFPDQVRRLDAFLGRSPFSMTLLIRLLPVGHNLSTNLVAGVSGVPATPFLLGSAVGYLPQTLIFALAGSGVNLDPVWRIGLAAALFVVSGVLGVRLYRRYRQKDGMATATGRGQDQAAEEGPPS